MSLDALTPDLLAARAQAQKFKLERKAEKIDSPSPLEIPSFIYSITQLCRQIGKDIVNYHLISDDVSGRIPTLILAAHQNRVEKHLCLPSFEQEFNAHKDHHQPYEKMPRVDFIVGSGHYYNRKQIDEFIKQNYERLARQPLLVVTDFIDQGEAMDKLIGAFGDHGLTLNFAIMSHYEPLGYYRDLFDKAGHIYVGERTSSKYLGMLYQRPGGNAVLNRSAWTGLTKTDETSDEPKRYHPILMDFDYRDRDKEVLVRQQIAKLVPKLPLPK